MKINCSQNLTDTQLNSKYNVSFQGLRKILDANTVESFWKKTQILGDVVIMKRHKEGYKQKLIPTLVSLVRTKEKAKGDKESKVFYALFEKGVESVKTPQGIDCKELGLMEVQYKNLNNICVMPENSAPSKSAMAVKRAYDEALKVLYLVSHEGDKYRGIGSKLLDCAVNRSDELGLKGKVFLHALNQIPLDYLKKSDYCKKMFSKKPTLFYYKYGFKADRRTNSWIEAGIDIDDITMHLPTKERVAVLQRLKSAPLIYTQSK